jgi:hypothetical protein
MHCTLHCYRQWDRSIDCVRPARSAAAATKGWGFSHSEPNNFPTCGQATAVIVILSFGWQWSRTSCSGLVGLCWRTNFYWQHNVSVTTVLLETSLCIMRGRPDSFFHITGSSVELEFLPYLCAGKWLLGFNAKSGSEPDLTHHWVLPCWLPRFLPTT